MEVNVGLDVEVEVEVDEENEDFGVSSERFAGVDPIDIS
ncbi:hypothetical protein J2X61_004486 [Bacillus sp. 3255]|nr:hypothetical protein [Bacillus sp. 3255]